MVAEMGNPHSPGKIGVTIKVPESKKYAGDNPWFVFEGTDAETVKQNIGKTFGIEVEGLTLSDVVINAQRLVTGLGAVAHGLGGTVLPAAPQGAAGGAPALASGSSFGGGDRGLNPEPPSSTGVDWSKVAEKAGAGNLGGTAPVTDDPILAAIEQAASRAELQQIWAENQAAFADDKYMTPWKAKGKSLSS